MRGVGRLAGALVLLASAGLLGACGGGGNPTASSTRSEQVSPRSAGFRGSAGVMKHLPEYGSEASAGERRRAEAALGAYLGLVGKGAWGRACPYVDPELRAQVDAIAAGSGQPPEASCGQNLRWYTETTVEATTEFGDFATAEVASLRVDGGSGFALIHGSDGEDYWAAMKLAGSKWKVLTLVPQPFG